MEIGLYEAVAGMKAQSAIQDTLASNLARMSVPGSKGMITAFEIPPPSSLQKGTNLPGTTHNVGIKAAPMQARTVIDFSQGTTHATGNPFDMAIEGDGNTFFKVREANGDFSYTRDGDFHLNPNGVLVTSDGAEVMMNKDVPLNLNPKDQNQIGISQTGSVVAGPKQTNRGGIQLVRIDDPRTALTMGAGGRFVLADPNSTSQLKTGLNNGGALIQGALEDGNTDSIKSMVSLVQVVRSYEANERMTKAEDDSTSKIIDAAASS